MTLTTSTITGRVPLPTDENLQFAELTFALSGLDTEGPAFCRAGYQMTKAASLLVIALSAANIVADLFGHTPTTPHQYRVEQR